MPDFQRALTAESAKRIETSPKGRARGEGWIGRARSSRRNSAGLLLMRMPHGKSFHARGERSVVFAQAAPPSGQTLSNWKGIVWPSAGASWRDIRSSFQSLCFGHADEILNPPQCTVSSHAFLQPRSPAGSLSRATTKDWRRSYVSLISSFGNRRSAQLTTAQASPRQAWIVR